MLARGDTLKTVPDRSCAATRRRRDMFHHLSVCERAREWGRAGPSCQNYIWGIRITESRQAIHPLDFAAGPPYVRRMYKPWHWPLWFGTGFVAGFVDSVAGGGGLITLPVLLNAQNNLSSAVARCVLLWRTS